MKFGRLEILAEDFIYYENNKKEKVFLCECECKNIKIIRKQDVTQNKTKSCGCLNSSKVIDRNFRHGYATRANQHPLYKIWQQMKLRILNSKIPDYKYYGGRNLGMYEGWLNSASEFINWALQNGWREGLQIDRRNNNLGYYPENCRFVTCVENSRNKRSNKIVNYNGVDMCLMDVADITNISYSTLRSRCRKGKDLFKDKQTIYLENAIKNKNNLAIERIKKKITLKDLSEQVGVHLTTIIKWEKNITRPNNKQLQKLSEILNVEVENLLKKYEGDYSYGIY